MLGRRFGLPLLQVDQIVYFCKIGKNEGLATMPAPKREILLDTAEALFSREGFKGVSIDRLLKEAGVAKMTLYKGFENKDELIRATLHRRANRLSEHLESTIQAAGKKPRDRLLCCFDAMETWAERADFNGCYFINVLAEYGTERSTEADIAHRYKMAFLSRLESLCQDCGVEDAFDLARSIYMLIDGATVTRLTLRQHDSFARAKIIAENLLRAALLDKQAD